MQRVDATYPTLAESVQEPFKSEVFGAVTEVREVLAQVQPGALPEGTANAMRAAISNSPRGATEVVDEIKGILGPADNFGGRMSFRWVAPLSAVIIIVFGVLYLRDRAAGGYKAETLSTDRKSGE